MKKLLLVFSLFSVIFLCLPARVRAQNKCGVNVGPNYHQVDQVRNLTKAGGWIVALGDTCSCGSIESLFGKDLNVVWRAYNGGRAFTDEEALGWVATLGSMDTKGQKIYFMPWNEPNHAGEGGGPTAGGQVYAYSQFLKSQLIEAGLLGSKVVLLSPMIDKLNPSFPSSFWTNPGGKGAFYSLFDGSSINEYDQAADPANYLACAHWNPAANNCRYDEIGIPAPFYALESGVAGTSDPDTPPVYRDHEIRTMLDGSYPEWRGDSNFKMFAIFSYDPHRAGDWDIYSASQTTAFYGSSCQPGSLDMMSGFNQATFDAWLAAHENDLVPCGTHCWHHQSVNPVDTGGGVEPPPPLPPLFDDSKTKCGPSGTDCSGRDRWEARTCWPDDCGCAGICNQTGYIHHACTQSFNVYDEIEYDRTECPRDEKCDYWIKKEWGGEVIIDPTVVEVPFAGKKKEGISASFEEGREDEIAYLADYFEGTNEYYRDYTFKVGFLNFHGYNQLLLTDYQGVLRKLAPYEYQNQLKKSMIQRAIISNADDGGDRTGKIHDYQLQYVGRLCWNAPFWVHVLETIIEAVAASELKVELNFTEALDYCLFALNSIEEDILIRLARDVFSHLPVRYFYEPSAPSWTSLLWKDYDLSSLAGHEPPSPADFDSGNDYAEAWDKWRLSENKLWWKLWHSVPMVTREDTRGYINAIPELRSGGGEIVEGSPSEVTDDLTNAVRFPHLARLFETSHWVQQILLPTGLMRTSDQDVRAERQDKSTLAGPAESADTPTISGSCGQANQTTLLASSGIAANVLGNKIMLAQTDEAPPGGKEVPFVCASITPRASYTMSTPDIALVSVTAIYQKVCEESGGMHIQPLVNGAEVLGGWAVIDGGLPFNLEPPWSRSPFTLSKGQCKTYRYGYRSWECPCIDGYNEEAVVCEYCMSEDGAFSSNCALGEGRLPPAPIPACQIPKVPESSQCVYDAITDPNPNDNICADQLRFEFTAVDEYFNKYCENTPIENCKCKDVTTCPPDPLKTDCERYCCRTEKVPVFRQVEVKTQIPYLTQIWDHANNSYQGFYNLFRPASLPEFTDTAAKSKINYFYRSRTTGSREVSVSSGDFYYPFLGGVQLGKDWVIKALTPFTSK